MLDKSPGLEWTQVTLKFAQCESYFRMRPAQGGSCCGLQRDPNEVPYNSKR